MDFFVDSDLDKAKLVMQYRTSSNFDHIYFSSNECLKNIFSQFDFKEKDILTVLGSGDQAFYFYDSNAKSVDIFDINKLAFYYYFLRMWVVKYMNSFYLPIGFTTYYIFRLIELVKPTSKDEYNALEFWKKYALLFENNNHLRINLFEDFDYSLPNKIENLKKIRKRILLNDNNMYNIDISSNFTLDKKYDVIYVSNISNWLDKDKFILYRDNLYNLLNDSGYVICANLSLNGPIAYEKEIFSSKFELHEMKSGYDFNVMVYRPPGYYYVKKNSVGDL